MFSRYVHLFLIVPIRLQAWALYNRQKSVCNQSKITRTFTEIFVTFDPMNCFDWKSNDDLILLGTHFSNICIGSFYLFAFAF